MSERFDGDLFEARLEALKDTQDGINNMSQWCLKNRVHHKQVIACWLNVFKRVRIEQRLTLFHLANDVIQYSKRKKYEYVAAWATALQRATTMVRDESIKGKILRIFDIWKKRDIYSDEFLADLSGLLNIKPIKKTSTPPASDYDYQNSILITKIRECSKLMDATDKSFKKIPKEPNYDSEHIKQLLKDKSRSKELESEIERYVAYKSAYDKNMTVECHSRREVISNIEKAMEFYTTQRSEVKLISGAYKTYGGKMKAVKKGVDAAKENLPSPVPSPDINAPSPPPDADIQLPDDQAPSGSMSYFAGSINGMSSFMNSKLPFDINDFKRDCPTPIQQPIEVIGSRPDTEAYNPDADFYKPPVNLYANTSEVTIPGLGTAATSDAVYNPLPQETQPYSNILPSSLYNAGNSDEGYNPHIPNYNAEQYSNQSCSRAMQPPPPLPPALAAQADVPNEDFDSSWNMSWLDNSTTNINDYTQSAVHSSLPFDSDPLIGSAQIDYTEHDNLMGTEDIDHRSIQLPPAFDFESNMPLGKDKVRDFGRRNLINLTGSPAGDKEFSSGVGGDIDYRKANPDHEKKATSNEVFLVPPPPPPPLPLDNDSSNNLAASQRKINTSGLSMEKDDSLGITKYDPSDMIVDMEMSDDDNEDLNKANVANSNQQNDNMKQQIMDHLYMSPTLSTERTSNESSTPSNNASSEVASNLPGHSFGEESLNEFDGQNIWDSSMMPSGYSTEGSNIDLDMQLQSSEHQSWDSLSPDQWSGNSGNLAMASSTPTLPSHNSTYVNPFQQMPQPQPQSQPSPRGRGRGWSPFYRPRMPPRGGGANSPAFEGARPYFPRGGGRGGPRPRFHGNNTWI